MLRVSPAAVSGMLKVDNNITNNQEMKITQFFLKLTLINGNLYFWLMFYLSLFHFDSICEPTGPGVV